MSVVVAFSASAADTFPETPGSPEFGRWFCVEPSKIFDVVFDDGELRVNNIGLSTETSLVVGAPTVTLTASISNRSPKNTGVSVDVFGSAAGDLKFVISAAPSFGFLAPSKTDQIQGWVIRSPEEVASLDRICVSARKVLDQ